MQAGTELGGAAGDNFVLEKSTQLGAQTNWVPVVETPVNAGGQRTVTVSVTGETASFRLRRTQ